MKNGSRLISVNLQSTCSPFVRILAVFKCERTRAVKLNSICQVRTETRRLMHDCCLKISFKSPHRLSVAVGHCVSFSLFCFLLSVLKGYTSCCHSLSKASRLRYRRKAETLRCKDNERRVKRKIKANEKELLFFPLVFYFFVGVLGQSVRQTVTIWLHNSKNSFSRAAKVQENA